MSPGRNSTIDEPALQPAGGRVASCMVAATFVVAFSGAAAAEPAAPAAPQSWFAALPEYFWPWFGAFLGVSILVGGTVGLIAAGKPKRSGRRATEQLAPVEWSETPAAETEPETDADGVGRWLLIGWDREGRSARFRFGPLDLARAGDGMVLGRNAELCHFVVGNTSVSRRHLRFSLFEGELRVEDLNTTNGTYLDGRRLAPLKPVSLTSGQAMVLGDFHLRFMDQGQP